MTLVEKLERRAREFDLVAKESAVNKFYEQDSRDLAELLLEAAKAMREAMECRNLPTTN